MKKETIDYIVKNLKRNLTESQKFWEEKEHSHAFIVGYLEGTIKGVIEMLDNNKEINYK